MSTNENTNNEGVTAMAARDASAISIENANITQMSFKNESPSSTKHDSNGSSDEITDDFQYQTRHSPKEPLVENTLDSPYSVYHDDRADETDVQDELQDIERSLNNSINSNEVCNPIIHDLTNQMDEMGSDDDCDAISNAGSSASSDTFPPSPPPKFESPVNYRLGGEMEDTEEESSNNLDSDESGSYMGNHQTLYERGYYDTTGDMNDEDGESDDEWVDDNDNGYVYIPISDEDFDSLEEEASHHLTTIRQVEEQIAAVNMELGYDTGCVEVEGEDDEDQYHDAYEGYEEDLAAAQEYQDQYDSQEAQAYEEQYLDREMSTQSKIQLEDLPYSGEQQVEEDSSPELESEVYPDPQISEDSSSGSAPVKHPVDDLTVVDDNNAPLSIVLAAEAAALVTNIDHTVHDILDSVLYNGESEEGEEAQRLAETQSDDVRVVEVATEDIVVTVAPVVGSKCSGTSYAASVNETAHLAQGQFNTPSNVRRNSKMNASQIQGQRTFTGMDGLSHSYFNLKVIFKPFITGFEEHKDFQPNPGSIVAGRYEVVDMLGEAAFSSAIRCIDLEASDEDQDEYVCLKVIKNNKDFFDQSLDEIKLMQYINSMGDPDEHYVLKLIDYFYCQEHLFIVSELLKENLYDVTKAMKESGQPNYFTMPRLKKVMVQCLEALDFIHSLNLIHCDVKPENIVIQSYSRCEVKLIDFGSSCFITDPISTYIQSRSYRAPEVILGCKYDQRIDVWSIGGVLAELYTGYVLFQNDSIASMLCRIVGILGPFPESVLQSGLDTRKYFTLSNIAYESLATSIENGITPIASDRYSHVDPATGFHLIYPKKTTLEKRLHLHTLVNTKAKANSESSKRCSNDDLVHSTELSEEEAYQLHQEVLFLDFVKKLLNLNYERRVTAREALQHPWLSNALDGNINDFHYVHPEY